MDIEKRNIIMKEINRWRNSKLLPEHYCDFLLNLYMDDSTTQESNVKGLSKSAVANSSWKRWLVICGIAAFILLLLLDFTLFSKPVQIATAAVLITGSYIYGITVRFGKMVQSFLSIGIGSIFLLFFGLYMLKEAGYDQSSWILGFVAICCLIWIFIGIAAKLSLLQFTGWIGILIVYGWMLRDSMVDAGWLKAEMLWVPVSFLFGWLGWIFHFNRKMLGLMFLAIGFILWFGAEIYTISLNGKTVFAMQISLFFKIAIAGAVLVMQRKKWNEWTAKS